MFALLKQRVIPKDKYIFLTIQLSSITPFVYKIKTNAFEKKESKKKDIFLVFFYYDYNHRSVQFSFDLLTKVE